MPSLPEPSRALCWEGSEECSTRIWFEMPSNQCSDQNQLQHTDEPNCCPVLEIVPSSLHMAAFENFLPPEPRAAEQVTSKHREAGVAFRVARSFSGNSINLRLREASGLWTGGLSSFVLLHTQSRIQVLK